MHRRVTQEVSNLRRKILLREKLARYTLFIAGIKKKIILPETVKKKKRKEKSSCAFAKKQNFPHFVPGMQTSYFVIFDDACLSILPMQATIIEIIRIYWSNFRLQGQTKDHKFHEYNCTVFCATNVIETSIRLRTI